MASFQAKTGRDRQRVIPKKKKLSFRSIPTRHGIGNSKNIAKICKKLRNIIVASFQGKTGRYRLRVIQKKKKKKFAFRFISTRSGQGNSQKIAKKMQEFKKHHYGFISSQNGTDRLRMIRKKCYRSDPFQLDPE